MVVDANELAGAIGARVRQARTDRHWTLDELAERTGVSRRMIVNVEQGSVNPSIGTLLRLSDALGIGLPALVNPSASTAAKVTRAGRGAALWTGEHGGRGVLVAGTEPPDVTELWDWTLGPGDRHQSEAHSAGTVELLHVLDGSVTVEVSGRPHLLEPGDALTFHGDTEHSYTNPHDTPARFTLCVHEPGMGEAQEMESTDD